LFDAIFSAIGLIGSGGVVGGVVVVVVPVVVVFVVVVVEGVLVGVLCGFPCAFGAVAAVVVEVVVVFGPPWLFGAAEAVVVVVVFGPPCAFGLAVVFGPPAFGLGPFGPAIAGAAIRLIAMAPIDKLDSRIGKTLRKRLGQATCRRTPANLLKNAAKMRRNASAP